MVLEKQRLFSRIRCSKVGSWLYLVLAFVSYALLAAGFQAIYGQFASFTQQGHISLLFDLAWCFILTAVVWLLPSVLKKIFMLLSAAAYSLMVVASGIMLNMFNRFFSFGDFAFAGDGAAFLDLSYLNVRKITLLLAAVCLLLMIFAVLVAPEKGRRKAKRDFLAAGVMFILGTVIALMTKYVFLRPDNVVVWDSTNSQAEIYETFSDTKQSMLVSGVYEYAFRDLYMTLGIFRHADPEDLRLIDDYIESRDKHENNDMSGIFKGKNLILIQLEAIDTWELCQEYMPNLYAIKQESIVFENHYTPAYITAGTFNTEFMVNTGLFPAETGTSTSVYTRNVYPYSLASLFSKAGYSSNSFHGSEGNIYNRGSIHLALGYEKYNAGSDMSMSQYTLDTQLMNGYEDMTAADEFFSFVITISGHGPYNDKTASYLRHGEAAEAAAKRSEYNYVHAVSHAMETDEFIGLLTDRLEQDGLLEDTVLVFYADHYNYYMLDDELNREIKGVDSYNMLAHTDFFIYSSDIEPMSVGKVTSSVDILPTLANLFGLDTDYRMYMGSDAFSEDGGYVFFSDGAWFDGETYCTASNAGDEYRRSVNEDITLRRQVCQAILKSDYYSVSVEG